MRSAAEARAGAVLLNSFLQCGPVWCNYRRATSQCRLYVPLKVISCPPHSPISSTSFKCDERSLSMVIVCDCVRECQFALNIMDSLVDALKRAHVYSMQWIRGCGPQARNDGLMNIKWVKPVLCFAFRAGQVSPLIKRMEKWSCSKACHTSVSLKMIIVLLYMQHHIEVLFLCFMQMLQ